MLLNYWVTYIICIKQNLKELAKQLKSGKSDKETDKEKVHSVLKVAPFSHMSLKTSVLSLTFHFLLTTVTLPFLPALWDSILLSEVKLCHGLVHEEFKGSVLLRGLVKGVCMVCERVTSTEFTWCSHSSSPVQACRTLFKGNCIHNYVKEIHIWVFH